MENPIPSSKSLKTVEIEPKDLEGKSDLKDSNTSNEKQRTIELGTFFDTTEIHDAAKNGDEESIQQAWERNPEVINNRDANNNTPLHNAAMNGQLEVCGLLLELGMH